MHLVSRIPTSYSSKRPINPGWWCIRFQHLIEWPIFGIGSIIFLLKLHVHQKIKWNINHRGLVKASAPEVLLSKRRGKRAGTRYRERQLKWQDQLKPSLPSIYLTNTRSIVKNYDHLEDISHHQLLTNCCIYAVTESWLTPNIADNQIQLTGYSVIRTDRNFYQSSKTKEGGLLLYINNRWAKSIKSYQTISIHILKQCRL